jgi:hypothetical protein
LGFAGAAGFFFAGAAGFFFAGAAGFFAGAAGFFFTGAAFGCFAIFVARFAFGGAYARGEEERA